MMSTSILDRTTGINVQTSKASPGGGGDTQLFSGRGVRPVFPKCGACELTFASEKGGLWAEKFQIWGLVSWKFPNLGPCELKFGWKLRLLRLKFQNFLKRGSCELTLLLEMGPLRAAGEAWKGDLQGRTSPYPLSRSVPPGGITNVSIHHNWGCIERCTYSMWLGSGLVCCRGGTALWPACVQLCRMVALHVAPKSVVEWLGWCPGGGGTHIFGGTGMCRSNGSLFYKKSLNMGPVFYQKILKHWWVNFSDWAQIFGFSHGENPENRKIFEKWA